jgi:hypothetical protein
MAASANPANAVEFVESFDPAVRQPQPLLPPADELALLPELELLTSPAPPEPPAPHEPPVPLWPPIPPASIQTARYVKDNRRAMGKHRPSIVSSIRRALRDVGESSLLLREPILQMLPNSSNLPIRPCGSYNHQDPSVCCHRCRPRTNRHFRQNQLRQRHQRHLRHRACIRRFDKRHPCTEFRRPLRDCCTCRWMCRTFLRRDIH